MNGFRNTLAAVLMVLAVAGSAHAFFGLGGKYEAVTPQGDTVRIKAADISEKARFYAFKDGGTEIRFFVVKSSDGIARAAFDACDVCWREGKGYRQEGASMICENCRMAFNTARINEVRGGCNPHPLVRTTDGNGDLLIRVADIREGARFFAAGR